MYQSTEKSTLGEQLEENPEDHKRRMFNETGRDNREYEGMVNEQF